MHPVELVGRSVRLREFEPGDVAAALALVGDNRVTRRLSFDERDEAQTTAMIAGTVERARHEPRTEYYLAVTVKDELVGFCRLGLNGVRAAKLGYAVRAASWGNGYATDAARTMVSFGFEQLGLHRISAAIGPDNAASVAVAERLGMSYEGRIRDHVFTNGGWRDSLLYAVLADDRVPG